MLTVCISGPERTRAKAELAIEDHDAMAILPAGHHSRIYPDTPPNDGPAPISPYPTGDDPPKGTKREKQGFITLAAGDVDRVAAAVEKHGWVLRIHHDMLPEPPGPSPLMATLADMQARIDALEAQWGG